jgi:1-acyl-sn-glycerol-3-phosphate acyltransferase
MQAFRTVMWNLCSRAALTVVCLIIAIPVFILLLLPEKWRFSKPFYWLFHFFYWGCLKSTFLPITFVGTEHVPNQPAIFVANHQSSLDIPLLGSLVDSFPHVWVAKRELLDLKVIGPILRRIAVLVDMSTPLKAMRSLVHLMELSEKEHQHVMIFPEGARYTDGQVHDFFLGFDILAKKTKRPVVPVYIDNAYKVYPPDVFWATYLPISVTVGMPFFFGEEETEESFKQRVHDWFAMQQKKQG